MFIIVYFCGELYIYKVKCQICSSLDFPAIDRDQTRKGVLKTVSVETLIRNLTIIFHSDAVDMWILSKDTI